MLRKRSIDQLLNLLAHVKRMNRAGSTVKTSYQEAVARVRKEYNVAYQTIGDLCCRRQGLTGIDVFINMLEEWLVAGNPEKLKQLLLSNSDTAYRNEITQFFNNEKQGITAGLPTEQKSIAEEYENFNVRLHKEHVKKLKVLTVMNEMSIHEKLISYLENRIDEEYTKWLQKESVNMTDTCTGKTNNTPAKQNQFDYHSSQDKQLAITKKQDFLTELRERDIRLTKKNGTTLYTNRTNKTIGIAYASECQPNKWWLGLPYNIQYHSMVFLCDSDGGQCFRFIFPKEFIEKYKDDFSKDDNEQQYKFNIHRENQCFYLKNPLEKTISINIYIDAFSNLE